MRYCITSNSKSSLAYLRSISKSVVNFIREAPGLRRELAEVESACFGGPDGILIQVFLHEEERYEGIHNVIYITEVTEECVDIVIPQAMADEYAPPLQAPKWVNAAFDEAPSHLHYNLAQLYFFQLPLRHAARVLGVECESLVAPLLNSTVQITEADAVLRASVTKVAANPEEIIVDIRGLLAWLLLNTPDPDWSQNLAAVGGSK